MHTGEPRGDSFAGRVDEMLWRGASVESESSSSSSSSPGSSRSMHRRPEVIDRLRSAKAKALDTQGHGHSRTRRTKWW